MMSNSHKQEEPVSSVLPVVSEGDVHAESPIPAVVGLPAAAAWRPPSDIARKNLQPTDICECRLSDVHIDPKTRLRIATMYVHPQSIGIVIGKQGRQLEALVQYAGDKSSISHVGNGVFEIKATTSQAIGRLRLKAQDTIKDVHEHKPRLVRSARYLPGKHVQGRRKSWEPNGKAASREHLHGTQSAIAMGFTALSIDDDESSSSDDNVSSSSDEDADEEMVA